MRILSIVGARPQFIKLKPIHAATLDAGLQHSILHTGQHYDARMSQAFFTGLSLPDPDINLEVGSGSHGHQTALMLDGIEQALKAQRPDWVLVYGDTNSTLAGALAAVKLGMRVAHIEAGLRSFNRSMPEEINRVATDHVSDVLYSPTAVAMNHLAEEGLSSRSVWTGDVMADLLMSVTKDGKLEPAETPGEGYVVATIHRPANTDDPDQLRTLVNALGTIGAEVKLVAHPRLLASAREHGIDLARPGIVTVEPLPYLDMLRLVRGSEGLVTDSGGLQKEAFLLDVPCTTLRTETEWPETLDGGRNVLDPKGEHLQSLATRSLGHREKEPYGSGDAAVRIVQDLISRSSL